MELLDNVYYGNTVKDYLVATGLALALFVVSSVVRALIARRLTRLAGNTHTRIDDVAVAVLEHTRGWALFLLALYVGALSLRLSPDLDRVAESVAAIALLLQIGVWASAAITKTVSDVHARRFEAGDTAGLGAIQMLSLLARIIAWVVVALLILANVGVNISALIAGLGIGGIAVALALQNVLGDLFASVSIVLDKPFQVGDFLIVGDYLGTVENIGLKTTRLRSLSGEQLVFANSDLLGSRIRNYKRMNERRAVFTFGVTYQTSQEALAQIPTWVEEIIGATDKTRFDRAHFKSFADSALLFEVVYYLLVPDFTDYMDAQQRINLELRKRLEAAGVEFAYPTQTLYVSKLD